MGNHPDLRSAAASGRLSPVPAVHDRRTCRVQGLARASLASRHLHSTLLNNLNVGELLAFLLCAARASRSNRDRRVHVWKMFLFKLLSEEVAKPRQDATNVQGLVTIIDQTARLFAFYGYMY